MDNKTYCVSCRHCNTYCTIHHIFRECTKGNLKYVTSKTEKPAECRDYDAEKKIREVLV